MKNILFIAFIIFCTGLFSQPRYDTSNPFTGDMNARSHGMYIGLGGTYTIPLSSNDGPYAVDSLNYEFDFSNKGKLGPYLEFGKWHILNYGLFHSLEYGLSYRQYNGQEKYEANEIPDQASVEPVGIGEGKFKSHIAHLQFFVNRAYKLSKLSFLQASLGADIGYRFIDKNEYVSDFEFESNLREASTITSHVNFRLSYATRLNRMYLTPFLQSSIFSIKEMSLSEANLPYFNSRYRPLVFGMRVQWLHQKKDRECAKKGPKNKKIYKKSTSLFGKDMKSRQIKK
ncbi:MAG: hypothetical protein HKN39_05040 [Flavobacteriales bacterium]|nr:hypothetical protein [Flavobacteriales bacterium]